MSRQRGGMSRRRFLELTGAVVAAAAVGQVSGSRSPLVKAAGSATGTQPKTEYRFGVCRMCQQPYCSFKATIQDGVVTQLEGVRESLLSNGTLCSRGNAAIAQHYNPYRLKVPLRRRNQAKGMDVDPQWEEISWDEALDIVAQRLRKIRAEDPRRFVYNQGFSRAGIFISDGAYVRAFGSPNAFRSNGPLCATHYAPSATVGTFLGPNFDWIHTKYCLNIGRNMGPSTGVAGGGCRGDGGIGVRYFMYAVEHGMQVVCVDPRWQPEAGVGRNRWIAVMPGTELALVLALTHVLLHELNVYDKEFVTWRTNGPYLVRPDGTYLRDRNGKPTVWDLSDGRVKAFDDPTLRTPDLESGHVINGTSVRPAFALLKENVRAYTAEWAAAITEIPAMTIRQLARELADNAQIGATIMIDGVEMPYRPVAVIAGRGAISHKNGTLFHLAAITINLLLGAVGVPGGVQPDTFGPVFKPDEDGLTTLVSEAVPHPFKYPPERVDLKEFYPNSHHMPHLAFRVISDPARYGLNYSIDTMLVYGGNSIQHNCAPEPIVASMRKIPFVVAISYHMDEPTWMADVVLPEDSNFERYIAGRPERHAGLLDGKPVAYMQTNIQRPVVARMYNTRQPDDIFIDIAERVGFLYGPGGLNDVINRDLADGYKLDLNKKYTTADLLDRMIKSNWGPDHGINDQSPFLQKVVSLKERYAYFYHPGRQTRHRLYFNNLLEVGRNLKANFKENGLETVPGWEGKKFFEYYTALPVWIDEPDDRRNYPLRVINWKTPQFIGLVGGVDNPWLHEVGKVFDPLTFGICMNPKTAAEFGLNAGDTVVVESRYGSTSGELILTQLIRPGIVGIAGNLGRTSPGLNPITHEGPNYNRLLTGQEGDIDPIAGSIPISEWVTVRRA